MNRQPRFTVPYLLILSLLLLVSGCDIEQEPSYEGMGVTKHIERLVRTEDERQQEKYRDAVVAVGGDGVKYIKEAWEEYTTVEARCRLASCIEMIGPDAAPMVPLLQEELNAIDEMRVSCAAMALGGIGPAAAPAQEKLGSLLRSSDYSTQVNLLYALGAIGPQASDQIPLMLEAVEREQTRTMAIAAMSRMGAEGVAAVQPWLEKGSDNKRLWACQILSSMSQGNVSIVLDLLAKALRDKNPQIRIEAAKALGAAGTDSIPVYPSLVHALRDNNDEVREAVIQALIRIGPVGGKELINALNDKYWRSREGAARVIGTYSSLAETAKSNLIRRLDDNEVKVRLAVVDALVVLGEPIVDDMIQQLRSDQVYRKWGGTRVLGEIGPAASAALPELQKLLNDKDALIRNEAQAAIKNIAGM